MTNALAFMHCCSHTCLCVRLLLSVTEHYLFVLKSPEVRAVDSEDEEEGYVSESDGGTCWDDMKSTTFPLCERSFFICHYNDHTLKLLPFNCIYSDDIAIIKFNDQSPSAGITVYGG